MTDKIPGFGLFSLMSTAADYVPGRLRGLDYYGECRPAGAGAGDFFDFIPLPHRRLVAVVGDVSGDAAGSPIILSGLQTLLRSGVADSSSDLASVVQNLNRTMWKMSVDTPFTTLFCAQIDPVQRMLRYVNAGHEPALLIRKGSRVRRLERTGAVLGLSVRSAYRQHEIPLEPGDLLVALTDGITESVDGEGRSLRDSGILDVLRYHPDAPASDLVGWIMELADQFARTRQAQDRTVVVVRFTGELTCTTVEEEVAELAYAAA